MTPEQRMLALADAATAGPWRLVASCVDGAPLIGGAGLAIVADAQESADAALIAYAASPDRVRAIAAVIAAARDVTRRAAENWGTDVPTEFATQRDALAALDAMEVER